MKKTLSLIVLAAFAATGLAACDKKPGGGAPDGSVPTPSTSPAPSPTPPASPSPSTSPDTSASSPSGAASS
jgi:hypothetical protein